MTEQQALAYIHSFQPRRGRLGPQRLKALLDRLAPGYDRLPCIRVTGTNGKGSIAALAAGALNRCGIKTGLFQSPYVSDFTERMSLGNAPITPQYLAELTEQCRLVIDEWCVRGEIPGEFEVVTALALRWFVQEDCQLAVMEVGIGSPEDATNALPTPIAALFGKIDLDHTDRLGTTPEEIAAVKALILEEGSVGITVPGQRETVSRILERRADAVGSHLIVAEAPQKVTQNEKGIAFTYRGEPYELSMLGRHQADNCAAVLELLELLRAEGYWLPINLVKEGVAEVRLPARLELLRSSPPILIDGAHNPAAAAALAKTLEAVFHEPPVAVVGFSADKDWRTALRPFAGKLAELIAVDGFHSRALNASLLADYAAGIAPSTVVSGELSALAAEIAGGKRPTLIFGSFYLAGKMRSLLLPLLDKS